MSKRTVCWFSCGAASAVATKLALQEDPNAVIAYQDTGSEHPDNERFRADCEAWFGKSVIVLKSEKFADIWEVFEARKYLVGVAGAPCTSELKRRVAEDFLDHGNDREVFGYTVEEAGRIARWKANNPERDMWPILIERGLTKADCLGMVDRAGIALPTMYRLGYKNNNCTACVKGQAGYWNKIRVDFPENFDRMSKLERKLDAAINKRYEGTKRIRIFLDELPPTMGDYPTEEPIACGLFCMDAADQMDKAA